NALYQDAYPLATALARPLIAQLLVEVAERERATAVAHGCTGKGNDQVRFDVAVRALDPKLEVIAPMRVGIGLSREQEVDYARTRGIEVAELGGYSLDQNLWGRSIETGALEDPWQTPPADVYEWTADPGAPPAIPTEVIIGFQQGIPVSIDSEPVEPVELVERLNALGGRHGVGRIHHIEDRLVGIKSREIYEAPAAIILHTAHAALEGLTLSGEQLRFNRMVSDELAQATYDGIWFSALHRDLREYVASSQRGGNREVSRRHDHGTTQLVGRRSDDSLYDRALVTYDADDAFDHAAAVGFIRIFGLPLRMEAARHGSAWSWTDPLLSELPVTVVGPTAPAGAGP